MDKKKPIGYTKEQTTSMKNLIERTQEKAGDYVGSGTVTMVPKKKKKMKRMQMGGKVMNPALAASMYGTSPRGSGPNDGGPAPTAGSVGAVKTPVRGPAMPVRGGGGVPLQGRGGALMQPRPGMVKGPGGMRFEGKPGPVRGPAMPYGGMGGPVKTGLGRTAMRGGGLARKGVGMALAKGGIVKAPARSYRDMRAGAGSGVGRIQKTKIAGRGR